MAGPIKPIIRSWHFFRAAALTGLLLYLSGLLGLATSPVKTIVSITFDDGYADQLLAASILRLHGMRATFYIINEKVGQEGYFSWDQLGQLQAEGNEIGGHTITHPNLVTLQSAALRHEICDGRVELIRHGLKVTTFAYPYGVHNEQIDAAVADCGYNSGRGVGGQRESIPPVQPYALRTMDAIEANTSQVTLRGYVKQAERAGGGWVQLLFHHVCSQCDPYSITPAEFSKFLDWLRTREPDGTAVRTIDEVIGGSPQPAIPAAP